MRTEIARALAEKYGGSVAYVEVADEQGDLHLGTAFHVGGGVFATARHVVEWPVQRVGITENSTETFRTHLGVERVQELHSAATATAVAAPLFHSDERVDVALLKTEGLSPPAVAIADPAEESGTELLLEPTLLMGYPFIPNVAARPLVVTTSEVTATVSSYHGQEMLVVSGNARPGLSGGPVLSESGVCRGMLIRSLVEEIEGRPEPAHHGVLAALDTRYVRETLTQHDLEADG